MMFVRWAIFALLMFLISCSGYTDKSVRGENVDHQDKGPRVQMPQPAHIAPGHCRIVGTVIRIDTTLSSTGPCAKAPCRATVIVDSILGYGSAFGNPLAVGRHIYVRFELTTAPTTSDLFPNTCVRLPGVSVGTRIRTDLEARLEMGGSEGGTRYRIQQYERLK
jgi:hypothetical protein